MNTSWHANIDVGRTTYRSDSMHTFMDWDKKACDFDTGFCGPHVVRVSFTLTT